jgi:SAM-dependent methyltransferase
MNYGYSNDSESSLPLAAEDEPQRYCIQLYHRIVSAIDVAGKNLLEVGCGRGGGASYVMRYLRPASMVGLDQSVAGTAFCRRYYDTRGLSFVQGDAERLPLGDKSVDAVVNVESSRCYGNMGRFLAEVARVLRDGGHLLFGDMRERGLEDTLRQEFAEAGLDVVEEEEITGNVVEALNRDSERRQRIIEERAPRYGARCFGIFAGTRGSRRYQEFAEGTMRYWRYLLRKPIGAG